MHLYEVIWKDRFIDKIAEKHGVATAEVERGIDPIPEEFDSYEKAAEFWDTHDTTDYPDAFHNVEVETAFGSRHYEVELDEEVIRKLRAQARHKGVTVSRLASDLLREQLVSYG